MGNKILIPTLELVRWTLDTSWLVENPNAIPAGMGAAGQMPGLNFHKVHFVDEAGNVSASVASMIQGAIMALGRTGLTDLKMDFPNRTYVIGFPGKNRDGNPIEKVKIFNFYVPLDVTMTTRINPHFSRSIGATFLFKRAIEKDHRYVLVAENGEEMAAQLSVPRGGFRVG